MDGGAGSLGGGGGVAGGQADVDQGQEGGTGHYTTRGGCEVQAKTCSMR